MATGKLSKCYTIFCFRVNTTELNQKCVVSPDIELSSLKWKVELSLRHLTGNGSYGFITIGLKCDFDGDTTQCEAQATFKLLHKDGEDYRSVLKCLPVKTYDNVNSSHGIANFIEWKKFQREYVQQNQATIEIEVSTSPLKRKRENCNVINEMSTKFHVTIEGVSKLEIFLSSEVVLQGIRWKILCQKVEEYLGIFLRPMKDDMDVNWSYECEVSFSLLPFDGRTERIKMNGNVAFHQSLPDWGFSKFIEWDELVKKHNDYVSDDKMNLFIELKVGSPKPMWEIKRHSLSKSNSSMECGICFERFISGQIFSTICGHLFCKPCIDKAITTRKCPTCQANATPAQLHPIFF